MGGEIQTVEVTISRRMVKELLAAGWNPEQHYKVIVEREVREMVNSLSNEENNSTDVQER